jgi:hypothetical protein
MGVCEVSAPGRRWLSGHEVTVYHPRPKGFETLVGWLDQRERKAVADLIEENRIFRRHVRGRLRLTDEERRRLARHGHRLGRRRLSRDDCHARHDSAVASATDRA